MVSNSEIAMHLKKDVVNTFCRVIVQIEKVGFGSAMRIYDMYDAWNPYEYKEDAMGENVQVGNVETESNGRRLQETPPDFAATMRSLMAEMQSYKADNERLVKA